MPMRRLFRCAFFAITICLLYLAPQPKALAAGYCSSSPTSTTFTYNAANIDQAQTITINNSWTCFSGNIFIPSYHDWLCLYMDSYTGQTSSVTYNGTNYAMNYTVYGTAGTGASSPNPAPTSVATGAGQWYGASGGSTVGTSGAGLFGPIAGSISITIPAGGARTVPPGTYTVTIQFTIDQQNGGATAGSPCTKAGLGGPDGDGQDWGSTVYTFTIVVPKICSVNTIDTLDFGNIAAVSPLANDVTAQGNIYFTCSLSTPYTIYLNDGLQRDAAGSGNRNMAGSGGSRLPYQLYTTAGRTTIWDSTNGVTGNGAATQLFSTVYGKIAAGSTLPGTLGTYRDSVIVTISY